MMPLLATGPRGGQVEGRRHGARPHQQPRQEHRSGHQVLRRAQHDEPVQQEGETTGARRHLLPRSSRQRAPAAAAGSWCAAGGPLRRRWTTVERRRAARLPSCALLPYRSVAGRRSAGHCCCSGATLAGAGRGTCINQQHPEEHSLVAALSASWCFLEAHDDAQCFMLAHKHAAASVVFFALQLRLLRPSPTSLLRRLLPRSSRTRS